MPIKEVECPALTNGSVAVCHFCIFTYGGAPSDQCLTNSNFYDMRMRRLSSERQTQATAEPQPILPDIPIKTPSKGADAVRKKAMLSMGNQYTVGD